MHIGILKTGDLPADIVARYGGYGDLFVWMLEDADPSFTTEVIDVENGEMPDSPDAADGWLVTGSRHGVYEGHPWIEPLKAFLRDCLAREVPVVGVCFGHQILAEAMGGHAEKSDKGWGLGVAEYAPAEPLPWAPELQRPWRGFAIHQDQVTQQPPDTTLLMTSEFCPIAALAYGPPEAPLALTVQPHPEYHRDLFERVAEQRLKPVVPEPVMERALASMKTPVDPGPWVRTIVEFFRRAQARRHPVARTG
jgi:GMP synthase-like glutamine amidotransferase